MFAYGCCQHKRSLKVQFVSVLSLCVDVDGWMCYILLYYCYQRLLTLLEVFHLGG